MSRDNRVHERHPTLLEVRFSSAADFVTEYAENLSAGGLFVRLAHNLPPLSMVQVQITLPGFRRFEVQAKVAHVLDEASAARYERFPGAGLQLVDVPEEFTEALMSYLGKLGARRDRIVLVENPDCEAILKNAGFRTESADLATIVEQTQGVVSGLLAVVVNKDSARGYRDAIARCPSRIPVIGCSFEKDEELLLVELDRLVALRD